MNGECSLASVEQILVPALRQGMVVLDNLPRSRVSRKRSWRRGQPEPLKKPMYEVPHE